MHNSTQNNSLLSWSAVCESLDVSVQQKIRKYLIINQIGSTNDWALDHCRSIDLLPAVCVAEYQSQGRGRRGRTWVSPYAQNIYTSMAWFFQIPADQLSGLGLVAAVVIVRLLKEYGLDAAIKWPNDVLVDGKKIAGALIESRFKGTGSICVAIGVGLNFNMVPEAGVDIEQPWTSMTQELDDGVKIDRNDVVGRLITMLVRACEDFEKTGLTSFLPEWQEHDMCCGRIVDVVTEHGCQQGVACGVNGKGGLIVRINGAESTIYAGDVSVRVR